MRRRAALAAVGCGGVGAGATDAGDVHRVDVDDLAPALDTLVPAPDIALTAPALAPVGAPFFVALTAAAPLTATVTLTVAGQEHAVHLYRGRGSVALRASAAGPVALAVDGVARAPLVAGERPRRELSGVLAGDELVWTDAADVVVTGDITVPAGATLTIAAGTRALLTDAANVEVAGALRSGGTAAAPVLFTAVGTAWGGLRVMAGGDAELDETWLLAGGGDATRAFGHSGSQPVVWVEAARLVMRGGGVLDSPGKAFGAPGGGADAHGRAGRAL